MHLYVCFHAPQVHHKYVYGGAAMQALCNIPALLHSAAAG